MNRTKLFMRNSFTTALLQIVTMIVGFITPRIMLSQYGSEINGLVSSVSQFVSYFSLVEAGLSSAAIYALYTPIAQKDHRSINSIVTAAKSFYTQAGSIFTALMVGLAVVYPLFVKTNVLNNWQVAILVLILGVNGALEFFTLSKYRAILTADQRTYVISISSIIQIILNTIIIASLAYFKVNIVLLRFVALFSIFVRSLILLIYCKRKYKFLNYKEKPNKAALNKRWDALYLQILGTIQTGAPVVLLTVLTNNLKLISVYSVFNMVVHGVLGVLSIFTSGLSASFGQVIAQKEVKTLQKAYREFEFVYYATITLAYTITFITIMPFINVYTKDVVDINYNLPVAGFFFVLNGLLYNIKTPQGMLVISAGLYKETRVQTTVQALIIVVFGAILTPFIDIYGVLIASVLSNLYRAIDLIHFIPKNVTKLTVKKTYLRVARIFLIVLISWIPFMFISYTPSNLVEWAVYAAVVALFSLLVVAVINIIFDKKETLRVFKRIKNMVKSK